MIEELVERAAKGAGLSQDQARTALAAALFLIRKHGEPPKVEELFQAIPGSADLAEEGSTLTQNKGGGLMAGLMRGAGGAGGAAMSDAMAMGQQLARARGDHLRHAEDTAAGHGMGAGPDRPRSASGGAVLHPGAWPVADG